MSAFQVEQRGDCLRIRVRVKPRASRSRVLGGRDGVLELSLAAPPVDGAANEELIRTLADGHRLKALIGAADQSWQSRQ